MTYISPMGAYIESASAASSSVDEIWQLVEQFSSKFSSLGLNGSSSFADDQMSRVIGSGDGNSIVQTAMKYLGYNESNGSYKKFTNGRTEAWCADFVTYVVKEALGSKAPSGFGSPAVAQLRAWGKSNNKFIDISQWKSVKPGDVMIQERNGASHTGIVTKVDADGTIHTIEGNTSDMVAERTYKPGSSGYARISGFVAL